MSRVKVYADIEGAARDWLRTVPGVTDFVASRVFFGLPVNTQWPAIVVRQVGGGPSGDAPITVALLQIDCWSQGPKKAQAAALKGAVEGAIESLTGGTPLGAGAVALWGSVESSIWLPDPESNQARYVITAEIAARAA